MVDGRTHGTREGSKGSGTYVTGTRVNPDEKGDT